MVFLFALYFDMNAAAFSQRADDRAARTCLQCGFRIFRSHDSYPANAHVKGVEAVLRIHMLQDFLGGGVVPIGNGEVCAVVAQEAFQVFREASPRDMAYAFGVTLKRRISATTSWYKRVG